MAFTHKLQQQNGGWNAFKNKDPSDTVGASSYYPSGSAYGSRPYLYDGGYSTQGTRTILTSLFNRIAVDVASNVIEHVYLDENDRYLESVPSGLNYCLTQEANIDQTGRDLIIDLVESLCDDDGVVAVVPVDTTTNPKVTGSYDIRSLRVGKILSWYPRDVEVRVYDDSDGEKKDISLPKSVVAIIQNPFYTIMNAPNSTVKRLNRKLAMLDQLDAEDAAGKLNLILQMPYSIKSPAMQVKADARIKNLEDQLANSRHGIAYIDGTEKITQLNREIQSNLIGEIADLTKQLFDQIGMTDSILNGTANEQTMKNYYVRTIDPFLDSITQEFKRKFLTKTARTQGQSIEYYRDPFTFTATSEFAEIADKFRRNEILTSNELRGSIGFKPNLTDTRADTLANPNVADINQGPMDVESEAYESEETMEGQ